MNLKEQISKDRISAMKDGNSEKKNILSVLLGELDRESKNPTEAQIIKKTKSLIESNVLTNNEDLNKYLEIYLPKTLSESELEKIINDYIMENSLNDMKHMSTIMKYLSDNYIGRYDGKSASVIVKNLLINKK